MKTEERMCCSRCGQVVTGSYMPGRCFDPDGEPQLFEEHDDAEPESVVWGEGGAPANRAGAAVCDCAPPPPLDFDTYQHAARRFAPLDLAPDLYLAVMALGVAGEAGEVADLVKKQIGHKHPPSLDKLIKELGDVLWYVQDIARIHDVSLRAVAEANIAKLTARYPEGFSSEASINRKPGDT